MTQRCPHCKQPIDFSVTVHVTAAKEIDKCTRDKEIIKLKKKFPQMTTRAIAEAVGCSFATVSRVLREESNGKTI